MNGFMGANIMGLALDDDWMLLRLGPGDGTNTIEWLSERVFVCGKKVAAAKSRKSLSVVARDA